MGVRIGTNLNASIFKMLNQIGIEAVANLMYLSSTMRRFFAVQSNCFKWVDWQPYFLQSPEHFIRLLVNKFVCEFKL